jgi:hypothetical protein
MEGMRKSFRQLIVLVLLVAVTSIYLNGTRIFAPSNQNSYLMNLRYEGAGNEWSQSLFGDRARWASMENYLRVANEYETRRAYGLLNDADEARYHQEFSRLARNALNDWQGYHRGAIRGKVSKELGEIPEWKTILQSKSPPIIVAGILAAAYTGRTLRYRLGDASSVETRTILNSARFESQYVGWSNSLIGATVGSTYEGPSRGLAMSVRKDVAAGVSVSYDRTATAGQVGVGYSTGF